MCFLSTCEVQALSRSCPSLHCLFPLAPLPAAASLHLPGQAARAAQPAQDPTGCLRLSGRSSTVTGAAGRRRGAEAARAEAGGAGEGVTIKCGTSSSAPPVGFGGSPGSSSGSTTGSRSAAAAEPAGPPSRPTAASARSSSSSALSGGGEPERLGVAADGSWPAGLRPFWPNPDCPVPLARPSGAVLCRQWLRYFEAYPGGAGATRAGGY